MHEPQSNYWLDVATFEIVARYPQGEVVISSGISPSASYHIGHFREIMTADALTWSLRKAGRSARHVHVVDNFDPLRKCYDFLPPEYEAYVGWPICLVPDPFACIDQHTTYAEHFYQEFAGYAERMGIRPDEVVRSYEDLYASGKMARAIELSVEKAAQVRSIFLKVSHRELPPDWLPLQLLSASKSFTQLRFASIDQSAHVITAVNAAGEHSKLDYTRGQVKLNWRLDWPARWSVLGVMVEPFSAQEHGAAGGSYETGIELSREIFNAQPPIPGVRYANVHMLGDTKKMSSSKNNLVTPAEALAVMPAEVLRYFVVRSRPDRTLYWDSAQGLFDLVREFGATRAAVEAGENAEFAEAYAFAVDLPGKRTQTITTVPFDHLVQVYQTTRGDIDQAIGVLARTGYASQVENSADELRRELSYAASWLSHYAPESVKFEVQSRLPVVNVTGDEAKFLTDLATAVESAAHAGQTFDGQQMHEAIYAAREAAGLKPGAAFKLLYQLVIARESGPKAGWFLSSLDQSWLIKRLRQEA